MYDAFLDRLAHQASQLRVGNPTLATTDVGPVVSGQQLAIDLEGVSQAKREGGAIVVGGHVLTDGPNGAGFFFAPTVIADLSPDATLAQTEVFGPILSIFRARNFDQAVELANGTQ